MAGWSSGGRGRSIRSVMVLAGLPVGFPSPRQARNRTPPAAEGVCFVLWLEVESGPHGYNRLGGALGAASATRAPSSPEGRPWSVDPRGHPGDQGGRASARKERDV